MSPELRLVSRDGVVIGSPVWVRSGRRLLFGRVAQLPPSGLVRVRLGDTPSRRGVHTVATRNDVFPVRLDAPARRA